MTTSARDLGERTGRFFGRLLLAFLCGSLFAVGMVTASKLMVWIGI